MRRLVVLFGKPSVILSKAKYLKFFVCEIFHSVQNDICTESETK